MTTPDVTIGQAIPAPIMEAITNLIFVVAYENSTDGSYNWSDKEDEARLILERAIIDALPPSPPKPPASAP